VANWGGSKPLGPPSGKGFFPAFLGTDLYVWGGPGKTPLAERGENREGGVLKKSFYRAPYVFLPPKRVLPKKGRENLGAFINNPFLVGWAGWETHLF